ncbi:hypothetical protein BN903_114 [Halorubrum sp. AJ67]|nr:hypothetical protein BN903_114 [Halorubrum sp. AJ67]
MNGSWLLEVLFSTPSTVVQTAVFHNQGPAAAALFQVFVQAEIGSWYDGGD